MDKNVNLKGRSFLKLIDFIPEEINYLLDLSSKLKKAKKEGIRGRSLGGKNIALIFEKCSTRTRCSFMVAAIDEGAHPEFLGKNDLQLGEKETVKDTARVMGRIFDGIEFRGFKHETVEILAEHSGVPVWNGLTDMYHPTQVIADFLTIKEVKGKLKGLKLSYVGDGRNNMANSLLIGAAKMGMDFRIVSPKELFPEDEIIDKGNEIIKETGGKITITDSIDEGVKDSDIIYTDVWVSMGEEAEFETRINLLKSYQVNMNMIKKANKDVKFMHCLPAFHNTETELGQKIYEEYGLESMEVSEEVFESEYSIVFEQSENRMHTIKAIMVATLGN
jgi:ornithine carbamoyltransferase